MPDQTLVPKLSRQRLAVLVGIVNGKTNAEMARAMCVTEDTVASHVWGLFKKLEIHDRGSGSRGLAVALGMRYGLITPDQVVLEGECPGARVMPNWCRCSCNLCQTGDCAEHWRLENTSWLCHARRHSHCHEEGCICPCGHDSPERKP
jgi:DNA-binding CsgD family transcriptional regulator